LSWFIVLGLVALILGIWVGLGMPGVQGGRRDRVVEPGRARRYARVRHLDWLRPRR
jgi:hypothetical protein